MTRSVIEVARRGGYHIVRPRHPEHATRLNYRGTPAFAPDPRWVIPGRYVPFAPPRPTTVGSVVEELRHVYEAPRHVEFDLDGQSLSLTAFNGHRPGTLTVLFTGATSGVSTYPANRSTGTSHPNRPTEFRSPHVRRRRAHRQSASRLEDPDTG